MPGGASLTVLSPAGNNVTVRLITRLIIMGPDR
jgi:hypothetical protein